MKDISKLAIELCQELGVPYSFGKGYATLDGVPMNQLNNGTNLFQERYQITRATMEEIMHQYLHPSREDAIAREKMMQELASICPLVWREQVKLFLMMIWIFRF